jgi:uncharacterized membrane protein YsdA (DUF1294 family)
VHFVAAKDPQGRLRAGNASLAGLAIDAPGLRHNPPAPVTREPPQPEEESRPSRKSEMKWKLAIFLSLLLPPVIGSIGTLRMGAVVPLGWYLVCSLLAYALYWRDKRSALRGTWRTQESVLHLIELLGGWPGALIAQQVFRHKTRKRSFQVVFWSLVLVHQVFWGLVVWGLVYR